MDSENIRDQLEQVLNERAVVQRSHDDIKANLETRGGLNNPERSQPDLETLRLREQVDVMRQEMRQLEGQQRQLETYISRIEGDTRGTETPPEYSVMASRLI